MEDAPIGMPGDERYPLGSFIELNSGEAKPWKVNMRECYGMRGTFTRKSQGW